LTIAAFAKASAREADYPSRANIRLRERMNVEIRTLIEGIQETMTETSGIFDGVYVTRVEGRISEYALHRIVKALTAIGFRIDNKEAQEPGS
jgi:hypothetical protein